MQYKKIITFITESIESPSVVLVSLFPRAALLMELLRVSFRRPLRSIRVRKHLFDLQTQIRLEGQVRLERVGLF